MAMLNAAGVQCCCLGSTDCLAMGYRLVMLKISSFEHYSRTYRPQYGPLQVERLHEVPACRGCSHLLVQTCSCSRPAP